jgi:hypothetical protein
MEMATLFGEFVDNSWKTIPLSSPLLPASLSARSYSGTAPRIIMKFKIGVYTEICEHLPIVVKIGQ